MTTIGRYISKITDFFTTLGSIFIIVMMLHITVDVICRYFFNFALAGTIEIVSYYYMIILAFFSLAFAEEKDRHISVELVTDMMPAWMQKHIQGLSALFGVVVFSLLTVRTFGEAGKKYDVGASIFGGTTNIPVWPAYYIVPLGCTLMLIILVYKLVCYATGSRSGLNTRLEGMEDDIEVTK